VGAPCQNEVLAAIGYGNFFSRNIFTIPSQVICHKKPTRPSRRQDGRDAIGIELNPEYVEMSRKRIAGQLGMLAKITIDTRGESR
jgi:hypothetical protein